MIGRRLHGFRRVGDAIVLSCMALAGGTAWAQQSPALDRVSIWLGGYYAHADTVVGARDNGGPASGNIDLENDLGFNDHKTIPRVRLDVLLGDSQGLSLDYYGVSRSGSRSLARDISYGGSNFSTAQTVRGRLDLDVGSIADRWWFGRGNDAFGLGLGAAYYRLRADIRGEAAVNGVPLAPASSATRVHAWAPMLQLGWRHAFSGRWRVYFDASGVKKNGGRLSGHIYNAALGTEWFPRPKLGLGAEYGYTRIVLHQHRDTYDADLDMKLHGPSLFLRMRF